jgi:hypothetical protein
LGRHAEEAGVCGRASAALGNIAVGSDAHRDACEEAGAIPAMVGAFGRHAAAALFRARPRARKRRRSQPARLAALFWAEAPLNTAKRRAMGKSAKSF